MMLQHKVFALVLATTFSAIAYPAINSRSYKQTANHEVAAIDVQTTTGIYEEYFGSTDNINTPIISDELTDRLQNGAWYNISATDQGNSKQVVQAQSLSKRSKNQSAVKRSSKSITATGSVLTRKQSKRYRNQTKSERTRTRIVTSTTSRIKQSIRNRNLNMAKKKRQRDQARGYLLSSQKRSKYESTRRFRHTRSGTTPSY